MAKDDYFVIVYQILAYLYQRLKKGEPVQEYMLQCGSPLFASINRNYWAYIIYTLADSGYIDGIIFVELDGLNIPYAASLENCYITPAGIAYLCDNSFIEKAKNFLKDINEIIPF